MVMMTRCVVRTATSGWVCAVICRSVWSSSGPEPTSAAAKAVATFDLPDPGGPVMSHEWVMPPVPSGDSAAFRSAATASSCPVRPSQTLTAPSCSDHRHGAIPTNGPMPRADRCLHLVARGGGVDHQEPVGFGGGHLEERLADGLVERRGLGLESVERVAPRRGDAGASHGHVEVEQHREVRHEPDRRPSRRRCGPGRRRGRARHPGRRPRSRCSGPAARRRPGRSPVGPRSRRGGRGRRRTAGPRHAERRVRARAGRSRGPAARGRCPRVPGSGRPFCRAHRATSRAAPPGWSCPRRRRPRA